MMKKMKNLFILSSHQSSAPAGEVIAKLLVLLTAETVPARITRHNRATYAHVSHAAFGCVAAHDCAILSRMGLAFRTKVPIPPAIATNLNSLTRSHSSEAGSTQVPDASSKAGAGFGELLKPQAECAVDVKSWNLEGLKKEITRGHLRSYKKCVKATERYQKAMKTYQEILDTDNPSMEVV